MGKRPRPAFGPGRSLATDTVQNLFFCFLFFQRRPL